MIGTAGRRRPWAAVAAATALNAPLGSLYAFSVFLQPLEALLGLSRTDLALVFGLASVGFSAGMNLAPYVYGLASSPVLVLLCAAVSTAGIALAATAGGLTQLAIGYGVLFGVGGGAGYILVQQTVNLAVTSRHGLVNGYLVSLLPAGAMIAAPAFGWSIRVVGVRVALAGLAAVLAITGATSAWLTARSGVTLDAATRAPAPAEGERHRAVFWRLWLIFFLAASAGLMVLSQAAGIITAYGGATALAVYGTTFITGSIAGARLGGGWMVDWLAIPTVAAGAHAVALTGNVALTLWPGPWVAVAGAGARGARLRIDLRCHGRRGRRLLEPRALRARGRSALPGLVRRRRRLAHRRRPPVRPDPWIRNGGAHCRRRQCAGCAGRPRSSPAGQVSIRLTLCRDRARGSDGSQEWHFVVDGHTSSARYSMISPPRVA